VAVSGEQKWITSFYRLIPVMVATIPHVTDPHSGLDTLIAVRPSELRQDARAGMRKVSGPIAGLSPAVIRARVERRGPGNRLPPGLHLCRTGHSRRARPGSIPSRQVAGTVSAGRARERRSAREEN